MSEGIRGGGPTRPAAVPQSTGQVERALPHEVSEAKTAAAHEAAPGDKPGPLDVFEGGAAGRPQLKHELQAVTSQRSLAGVQFSDQELAKLASQLVQVFKRNPKSVSRAARAKLATRAILRGSSGSKLAKVLEKLDEQEAEEMENEIAGMVAESPRLGEWLDHISEEASRT